MCGNCFGVHFLAGFIFLSITRRVLPERIIFSREICVSIYTNRCECNYFCELRWMENASILGYFIALYGIYLIFMLRYVSDFAFV